MRRRRGASRIEVPVTTEPAPTTACAAPSVLLYFQPDGDVRACCRNWTHPLGNVGEERLTDIWHGSKRALLAEALAHDDYSLGCAGCAWEVSVVGRDAAYPSRFDDLGRRAASDGGEWPRAMEFNLSNVCNLQCIQCNGDLSSSIRIHREGRPPLPKVYGDEFFADLALFLPHLEQAQFAGGEPFMAPENFRVWDLIADTAPQVACTVVTNATQWNSRVEAVLERVPMSFCFSIDGITEATYEAVRLGADFDAVLANVDRFCAYTARVGTTASINFCLMAQNYQEFGDLLLFAEERGIYVDVSAVHYPEHCAIPRLPGDEIRRIADHLEAESDRVLPHLELNAPVWRGQLSTIREWADGQEVSVDHEDLWIGAAASIAGLPGEGWGATDDTAARVELQALAADGQVHELTVGPGEQVLACAPSLASVLGADPDALVGSSLDDLHRALADRFGAIVDQQTVSASDDRIDLVTAFADRRFRSALVGRRGEDGRLREVGLLLAALD
jgi:MoaA/NifB/PqqE/SkfB family radical SAM enzyme